MAELSPIPEGMHSITPHLVCRNAADAIAYYIKGLDGQELGRMTTPDGSRIIHSSVRIGDSTIFVVDEFPEWGSVGPATLKGSPVTLHLYVPDADAAVAKAVEAGAKLTMPVADMFWGDRYGKIEDPFGHHWSIATRQRMPSAAEMQAAARQFFGG